MTITTLMLLFQAATVTNHLPVGLIEAVCQTESNFDTTAVHIDDGAYNSFGICQTQYPTAQFLGFKGTERELMDPRTNIHYAALYLRYQLSRYRDNVPAAIAAYNAGSYRVNAKGLIKNRQYVQKVLKNWSVPQEATSTHNETIKALSQH